MKVVVITGGIGSGKSAACAFLSEEFGWPVYYADEKVKQLYSDSPSLLSSIERELGKSFRDTDGAFDPCLLAGVIFSDPDALAKVEALVFPALTDDFLKWKSEHDDVHYGILESATILEKPQLRGIGDITVLIDAPVCLRVDRAARRDCSDKGSIMTRIENQRLMNDISNRLSKAPVDYVIDNVSTVEALYEKLRELVKKLK